MKKLAILICLFWGTVGFSQQNTDYDGVQVSLGSAFFHGDVGSGSLNNGLNASLAYRHLLSKKWSVRPKIGFTRLQASDKKGNNQERNLSFKNNSLRGEIAVIKNFVEYNPAQHDFAGTSPYLGIGLGGMTNNPKAKFGDVMYELQSLRTEGVQYSRFAFYVPFIAGFNIHVNNKVYFGIEYTFNYVFSDYIDDVSGTYTDNAMLYGIAKKLADRTSQGGYTPSQTIDGKTWQEGSKRGSNNRNDFFSTISIHIAFCFHSVK